MRGTSIYVLSSEAGLLESSFASLALRTRHVLITHGTNELLPTLSCRLQWFA